MLNFFITNTLIEIAGVVSMVSQKYFSEATLTSYVLFDGLLIVTVDYEHLDVCIDAPDLGILEYYYFGSLDTASDIKNLEAKILLKIREVIHTYA